MGHRIKEPVEPVSVPGGRMFLGESAQFPGLASLFKA